MLAGVATIATGLVQLARFLQQRHGALHVYVTGVDLELAPPLGDLLNVVYQKFNKAPDLLKPGMDVDAISRLGYTKSYWLLDIENRDKQRTASDIQIPAPGGYGMAVSERQVLAHGSIGDLPAAPLKPGRKMRIAVWSTHSLDETDLSSLRITSGLGKTVYHFLAPTFGWRLTLQRKLEPWLGVLAIAALVLAGYALLIIVRFVRVLVP
jgi:hypothetical protein